MALEDKKNVIEKMLYYGNDKIYLCDRGACFSYHNIIADMVELLKMKEYGHKVIFDATHSV